jgi:hypothetical protein
MYEAKAFCAKRENRILHRDIERIAAGAGQALDGKIADDHVNLDPSSIRCPSP